MRNSAESEQLFIREFSEPHLLSEALALGALKIPNWSAAELQLIHGIVPLIRSSAHLTDLKKKILGRLDPLGTEFCLQRSPEVRRISGATYTPRKIVQAMCKWASTQGAPVRVVEPGLGSGRFLAEAGRLFPHVELVGIETDPVASIVARANLVTLGFESRTTVLNARYQDVVLPKVSGQTLYIGNPPYVRHHLISPEDKCWLSSRALQLGLDSSQLAGLHAYFFLATLLQSVEGDYGAYITSSEWLDVNYGKMLRQAFLGRLGGLSLTLMEPTARPFEDAQTTAVITTFQIGARRNSVAVRRVVNLDSLGELGGGRRVRCERMAGEPRWTHFTRARVERPQGFIELGELFRVHRGQVTGSNDVWIAGSHAMGLPLRVLYPTVTRARELFNAGEQLSDTASLKCVVDLPILLNDFDQAERGAIDRFLAYARTKHADKSYVAQNRKAWWSVGLRTPAPILATYMARRPPAFVRNGVGARHLNIAHGLYPYGHVDSAYCIRLVKFLSTHTSTTLGRTYAGGLTKFEPREMERIPIPTAAEIRNFINA